MTNQEKLPTKIEKKKKKKWVRWLERIALGVALLLAVLSAFDLFLSFRSEARLESKLEALRDANSPTSIRELAPPPIKEGGNLAATLLDMKPTLYAVEKEIGSFYQSTLGKEYLSRLTVHALPTVEQAKALEAITSKYDGELDELRQAINELEYSSILDYSVSASELTSLQMTPIQSARFASRWMEVNVHVSLVLGKADDAALIGIDILRLSRHIEDEPTNIGWLIAVAIRNAAIASLNYAIRFEDVSLATRDHLDSELENQSGLKGVEKSFKDERAYGLETIELWRDFMPLGSLDWRVSNWQLEQLDYYDELLPLAKTPWHIGHPQLSQAHEKCSDFVQSFLPANEMIYQAGNRDLAVQRCLRVLNEFERFKTEQGKEASGLSDLSLPPELTTDPFSGKPLIVKQAKKGWIIYSVYSNGVDDGAKFKDLLDFGLSPYPWGAEIF